MQVRVKSVEGVGLRGHSLVPVHGTAGAPQAPLPGHQKEIDGLHTRHFPSQANLSYLISSHHIPATPAPSRPEKCIGNWFVALPGERRGCNDVQCVANKRKRKGGENKLPSFGPEPTTSLWLNSERGIKPFAIFHPDIHPDFKDACLHPTTLCQIRGANLAQEQADKGRLADKSEEDDIVVGGSGGNSPPFGFAWKGGGNADKGKRATSTDPASMGRIGGLGSR
eukprot:1159066-Pelagomonas_calceolata.AAC.5